MSIAFDSVGEIENSFVQLTAYGARSSLSEDNASPRHVVVKHISVPDFKPQLPTHFHRSKVISCVPHWVVVIHHRVRFLVHSIVEDLHVGVCFRKGVCLQTCSSVDHQCQSSSARLQGTAVVVQVWSRGAVLQAKLVLLQLVLFNVLCDSGSQVTTDL